MKSNSEYIREVVNRVDLAYRKIWGENDKSL
jgi:hypothetical protein